MKKLFIDTNVIMDIIGDREGKDSALQILQMGESGQADLTVSILTMANIAYIARKRYTKENLYPVMEMYNEILTTLSMDAEQLEYAIQHPSSDFEDVLQYACAKANACDVIVTSNTKHYKMSDIPVMTPAELIK